MLLNEFSYLCDENINPAIVKYLREKYLDVKDVREEKLIGSSDIELMKLSFKKNRVIITQYRDFGKLVYTQDFDFIGVIYLRPGHVLPEFHFETINFLIKSNLVFEIPFILVAENTDGSIKIILRNNLIL